MSVGRDFYRMQFIEKEKSKLLKSAQALQHRRCNWSNCVREKILEKFQEAEFKAHEIEYPFRVFVQSFSEASNEATIQLNFGFNPTGVQHKKTVSNEHGVSNKITNDIERGCCLVASQAVNGSVAFIMYPYESDRSQKNEENIVIYSHLNPNQVTSKLLDKTIRRFFLYARTSSIYGVGTKPSLIENLPIFYMIYRDIRNRRTLLISIAKFISEWGKAIIAAIVTYVFTKYTTGT